MPSPATSKVLRLSRAALLALLAAGTTPAWAQGVAGPYLAAEHAAREGDVAEAADRYAAALARDPENVMLLDRALGNYLAAGRVPEGTALARRMQQLEPGRHLAVMALAAEAIRLGRGAEATEILATEEGGGATFVSGLLRAWALATEGKADEALALLRAQEEENAGGPAGQALLAHHRALLALTLGDDAVAGAAFEDALEHPGSPTRRMMIGYAGTLDRLGRTEDAIAVLEKELAESYGDAVLAAALADLRRGDGLGALVSTPQQGAAEALFGLARYMTRGPNAVIGLSYARLATELNPGLIDAHLLIAAQLQNQGNDLLAVEAYEQVPENAPEALDARIGRAESIERLGREEAGVQALRAVVARWPNEIDAHRALGDMLRRQSRFEEAAEAYDGAIALIETAENRHWPLYYQRGIAYERSKQWEQAEADFFMALELEPDQPLVLNYLGYSWVEMGMHLDRAQAMIEKAVEQRPQDGYIVDSLGWVLYRLGDFEGAVKHLGRAVELRPVDPVINDHYGDALWMVGRHVEAEFQWRRALSFDPDDDVRARIHRKLDLGLDKVMAEEAAAGTPAVIGQTAEEATANDGG